MSHNDLYNGKNFNTYAGSVNYYNKPNDIGASVGAALTPGQGTKYNVNVDKNLWRSKDGRMSVNAVGTASKVVGAPQNSPTGSDDWTVGFGLGSIHRF